MTSNPNNMDYMIQYILALPIAYGISMMIMYFGVKRTLIFTFSLIWLIFSVAFTISALNYIYSQMPEYSFQEIGISLMIISIPMYIGIIGTVTSVRSIRDVVLSRKWAYR